MTRRSDLKSENIRTALFAGSFNPFTIGHADIVERSLELFDRVVIAVGYNEHKPGGTESAEHAADEISLLYTGDERVKVISYSGLTADLFHRLEATVLVRGVRNSIDYEYEKNLAEVNMEIADIPTVFLPCRPRLSIVSSSMVRELEHNGYDASKYVATSKLNKRNK